MMHISLEVLTRVSISLKIFLVYKLSNHWLCNIIQIFTPISLQFDTTYVWSLNPIPSLCHEFRVYFC